MSDDRQDDPLTNPTYRDAVRWVQLGISPIPIARRTKEPPLGFQWGVYTRRLPDQSELYEWFVVQGHQIAITPGQINPDLAVLDCDTLGGGERLIARFPFMAKQPYYITGSDKLKFIIRLPAGKRTGKYTITTSDGDRWEVRVLNHYDVAPDSIHPDTGKPYAWVREPWQGIGVVDLEAIGFKYKPPAEADAGEFFTEGEPLTESEADHLIEALRNDWQPGRHHDLALSIAGYLSGYRVPEDDAWHVVANLMARGGGDQRDLKRAVHSTYQKAAQGVSVAGWARLTDRDDPLVARATAGRLDLLMRGRRPDFRWDDGPAASAPSDLGAADDDEEYGPTAGADYPWIVSMEELLDEPEEGDTWHADGLVQQRAVQWVAGPGKTYKSFLTMAILVALAAPTPVWGAFHVPVAVPVLYVQEESSRKFIRRRFRAIARGYGLDPAATHGRIHIVSNTRFRIDRKEDLHRLVGEAVQAYGIQVVAFDPFRAIHRLDENSSDHMQRVMDRFLWLRDQHGVTILLVHHFGKQGDERRDRWDGDEMRGSSALWASGEGGMLVHPHKQDDRVSVRLRLKEGRPPDDLLVGVEFDPDTGDDGGRVRFRLIEGGGSGLAEDVLLAAVADSYVAIGAKRAGAWPTISHICQRLGMSPRTIGPKLAKLESMVRVQRFPRHKQEHLWAPIGAPPPTNGGPQPVRP